MGTSKTSPILGCSNGDCSSYRNMEQLDFNNASCVEATQYWSSKYNFVSSKRFYVILLLRPMDVATY